MNNFALHILLFFSLVVSTTFAQSPRRQQSNDKLNRYDQAQVTVINDVKLASTDAGIVESISFKHGERVKEGELIAQLDDSLYRAQVKTATVEHLIAKIQSTNDVNFRYAVKSQKVNDKVLERSLKANEKYPESISKTEIDQLTLSLEQSVLSAEQAEFERDVNLLNVELRESQLATTKIQLDNRTIESPIDGQVVDLYVQVGEWANAGQPLARIVNLKRLRVKAIYSAELLGKISKETKAQFEYRIGNDQKKISAKIYFISPEIDPANQDFEVWADVDNSDGDLRPGIKGSLILDVK